MKMKRLSSFSALAALVVLASCGGDSGPNFADEIDESNMGGAAETSYDFVSDVANGIMQGEPSADVPLAPPLAGGTLADRVIRDLVQRGFRRSGKGAELVPRMPQLVGAACQPVVTGVDTLGSAIDTDDDGIPDDLKITFGANCTVTEGDLTWTYSGSFRLRDVAGLFGYRLDAANLKYHEENMVTEAVYDFTVNGSETALYTASSATHTAGLAYSIHGVYGKVAPPPPGGPQATAALSEYRVTFRWDENTSFDPDGTITLGAPVPSGDLDIDLDFQAVASSADGDFAFHFTLSTPTVLHYDNSSCYDFTSGQLKGALNGSADIYFLITWTDCGTTTYETHGTTDGGVVTARQFGSE